ncbi:G-type lectin S-receptor-like serine/threonine-protein kinase SD2-5 isoform X1 [Punica granatum]|uniref:Receptor-like serine/threonine-protein kinase n=2 Tax=Punica granatum TaxID=22663 RepID=A0A6P8CW50_PUNGR|nr:G-type lectin S-receptor-like serine/threonine-protein kinase SD2-5 isoform X1 [Punica granatum]
MQDLPMSSICIAAVALLSAFSPIKALPSTASLSTLWTLNPDSYNLQFRDGSTAGPILENAAYGSGFYRTDGGHLFSIFYLICNLSLEAASNPLERFMAYGCYSRVVWSANRNNVVQYNAKLELKSDGDLVLKNANGTIAWSTNTSGRSVVSMNLTEFGNLLLLDKDNDVVWESFSHPTDVLVPRQRLTLGQKLTPSASSTNFTEYGLLSLSFNTSGLYALVETNPPLAYYSTNFSNLSLDSSSYIEFRRGSLALVSISNYLNLSVFSFPASISKQFIRMSSDGHLRVYEWHENQWQEIADILTGEIGNCGYPLLCGEYGICSNGQCTCPASRNPSGTPYFKQLDDRNRSLGCPLTTPLSCDDPQNHSFVKLEKFTYFTVSKQDVSNTSLESCQEACARSCSCKAAFYSPSRSYCSLQAQVLSMISDYSVDVSAYIKVQNISSEISPPPLPPPPPSNPTTDTDSHPTRKANRLPLILGPALGSLILLVVALVLFIWKRRAADEADEEYLDEVQGMPSRFPYNELKSATENFCKKIGEGGYGSVFQGTLADGTEVAVKRLEGLGQIKKSFLAEVKTIGKIHHVNLVRLLGFCAEKSHRLLVYEFMSGGSLDGWIFHEAAGRVVLDWQQRKKVVLDIAKGLNYLHEDCWQKIIHLDIKPQNILLDENLSAKVSDFGLSKLVERDKSRLVTTMRGTPGYIAPEWLSGVIIEKADVYSFGVVALEIACARKVFVSSQNEEDRFLLHLLKRKAEEDRLLDMVNTYGVDMQLYGPEVANMIKLAAWCLQADYTKRPSMSMVIQVLDGVMEEEDNLDFNFWNRPVTAGPGRNRAGAPTAPPLPWILSGPR